MVDPLDRRRLFYPLLCLGGSMSKGLKIGSLFSGIGGLDLAVEAVTGGEVAWQCERDPYCRRVLSRHWPDVPIFEDVEELKNPPRVDVLAGGFPCQDISHAGHNQKGIEHGKKSGLWREFARIIRMVRPRFIFLENVSAITLPGRGLDIVLGDLAEIGINAEWACFQASDIGAPHIRDRWFLFGWVADADRNNNTPINLHGESCERDSPRLFDHVFPPGFNDPEWNDLPSPIIRRGPDGFSRGLDVSPRLRALGNAVCPQQAVGAYRQLMERACQKD